MAKVSKKTKKKNKTTGNGSRRAQPKPPQQIEFHYIKGPDFRTIHVDGAIGGITPKNLLHVALFSERPAIPTSITHELNTDGTLGQEVERSSKSGIARQMEVDVFMTEETAKTLRVWLDEKLRDFEARRESLKTEAKK